MLEKFKLFFNSLSSADREEALQYILKKQNKSSLNEGLYTGPSSTIEKGLYTGPSNSRIKCKLCGK